MDRGRIDVVQDGQARARGQPYAMSQPSHRSAHVHAASPPPPAKQSVRSPHSHVSPTCFDHGVHCAVPTYSERRNTPLASGIFSSIFCSSIVRSTPSPPTTQHHEITSSITLQPLPSTFPPHPTLLRRARHRSRRIPRGAFSLQPPWCKRGRQRRWQQRWWRRRGGGDHRGNGGRRADDDRRVWLFPEKALRPHEVSTAGTKKKRRKKRGKKRRVSFRFFSPFTFILFTFYIL